MSSAAEARARRELGANLPTGPYRMAEQTSVVLDVTPKPKSANYMIAGGIWMIQDGDKWRAATVDEIKQVAG